MPYVRKLAIILLILNINSSSFAIEIIDKTKKESKDILKKLSIKSLKKNEVKDFISEYVIIIDDKRDDGIVTYFFKDKIYHRYKDLELISQDYWNFSNFGNLQIFNKEEKNKWKIQTDKKNIIKIQNKSNLLGELYEFSYQNKTNYYLKLEEKKLNH